MTEYERGYHDGLHRLTPDLHGNSDYWEGYYAGQRAETFPHENA